MQSPTPSKWTLDCINLTLLKYQNHYWTHSKSRFKMSTLEGLSLYEFTSIYKRFSSIKQLILKKSYPQWASHSLKAQTFRCIVNVSKARLLDISQKELAPKMCLSYFQTLLILHKPFCYLKWPLGWSYFMGTHISIIQPICCHASLRRTLSRLLCGKNEEQMKCMASIMNLKFYWTAQITQFFNTKCTLLQQWWVL
jgi:hypothetical protein